MKMAGKLAQPNVETSAEPHPHKPARTWILIADESTVKIFTRQGGGFEMLGKMSPNMDEQAEIELTNKTIGRGNGFGGNRHFGYEPTLGESRQTEIAFAKDVASWLEKARGRDAFEKLVLIAAPKMLGELRAVLCKNVQECITAEISKDLAGHDDKHLAVELPKLIPGPEKV